MRALVLLSGGLDSTVATWWALEKGDDVQALTFHYFKRPSEEIEATRAISERAGIDLIEVDLPWLRELDDPPHPLLDNPGLDDAAYGYVPARNAIFYTIAAHHAEILGADRIVGGHNGVDPESFPDAHAGFFEDLATLVSGALHTDPGLEIAQPLLGQDKVGVVERGRELGAPLELCWSCYEEGPQPCGQCPSCREREAAFGAAGLEDPLAV